MKRKRAAAQHAPQDIDTARPVRVLVAVFAGARFYVRHDPKLGPKFEIDLTGVTPALRARAEALRGSR